MNIGTFLGYGATVFTPWMRRGADNAVFTFEVIDNPDEVEVTFGLYAKNQEAYGAGTLVDDVDISSESLDTLSASGIPEMVRFCITVSGIPGEPTAMGIIYRILEPTWYDEAVVA